MISSLRPNAGMAIMFSTLAAAPASSPIVSTWSVESYCSITGIDINEGMLTVARRNPQIEWHQGSATELPFAGLQNPSILSRVRDLMRSWTMIKSLIVAVTLIAVAGATRTVAQPTANPDATLPAGVGAPYRELMVPSQFPTLAAAVNAANADTDRSRGVVITIDPGTYTNDFTPMLTRPMTIRSAQGLGTVTLNSTVVQNANSNPGIITSHTDLTVDGLIFTGARNGSNNGAGIRDRRGVGAAPGFLAVQNSIFI